MFTFQNPIRRASSAPQKPSQYYFANAILFGLVTTAAFASVLGAVDLASKASIPDMFGNAHLWIAGALAIFVAMSPIVLAKPNGESGNLDDPSFMLCILAMMFLDGVFLMNAIRMYMIYSDAVMPTLMTGPEWKQIPNVEYIFGFLLPLIVFQIVPFSLRSKLRGITISNENAIKADARRDLEAKANADAIAAKAELAIEAQRAEQALAIKAAEDDARAHQIKLAERRITNRAKKAGETLKPAQFRARLKAELEICGIIEPKSPKAAEAQAEGFPEQESQVVILDDIRRKIQADLIAPKPSFTYQS